MNKKGAAFTVPGESYSAVEPLFRFKIYVKSAGFAPAVGYPTSAEGQIRLSSRLNKKIYTETLQK
ncbi:MAG: hypothetical protein SFU91_00070 [Chloroherpetonaceae bacterium]|nr:hypothetical protein [Chloroherpetonaceae bacterium]